MSNAPHEHEHERGVGQFVSGGYRPAVPSPVVLPPIAEVEPNTVYQDANGDLWKARPSGIFRPFAWVRALIVTQEEHRAAERLSWVLLGGSGFCMVAVLLLIALAFPWWWTGLFTTVALGLVWREIQVDAATKSHIVAPSVREVPPQPADS